MLERLTGDDLFAQLLMLRTSDKRTIILVEGASDCDALDPHLDCDISRTLPAHSKQAVERAIELVDRKPLERVVGLIDRDYDGDLRPENQSQNVVYTDLCDLDATIILSGDVLHRLLSSFADRDRLSAHLTKLGLSARELLIRLAGLIGLSRRISVRDGLEIRFREFPVHACTEAELGRVDIPQLAVVAIGRSKHPHCDEAELSRKIRQELAENPNLEALCNGHDLAAQIATLIREKWAGSRLSRDIIERTSRASFSRRDLEGTEFFQRLTEWASRSDTRIWRLASPG